MNECPLCRKHEVNSGFRIRRCAHFDGWEVKLWECPEDEEQRFSVDRPLRAEWFDEWPDGEVDDWFGDWHGDLAVAEAEFERQCEAMRQL